MLRPMLLAAALVAGGACSKSEDKAPSATATEKAKDTIESAAEKAKEKAGVAVEKAKEAAGVVRDKAEDVGKRAHDAVRDKLDQPQLLDSPELVRSAISLVDQQVVEASYALEHSPDEKARTERAAALAKLRDQRAKLEARLAELTVKKN